jgi:Fe-S-cluster-containing hydrogenase component 2
MLINDGILAPEELNEVLPSPQRLDKGPVVIVECIQDIPCDPCVSACPVHAITMQAGITDRPHVDHDTCTGCGLCIAKCPGLAIFVVNTRHSEQTATISMAHEMLPLPTVGQTVTALDRTGKAAGEAKVLKVLNPKSFDKTAIITLEVPQSQVMTVRAFRLPQGGQG